MIDMDWKEKSEQNFLLFFGILIFIIGIFATLDSYPIKSGLKEVRGKILSVNIYIQPSKDKYGRGSQDSELIFYLKGQKKKFYMKHNIGKTYYDHKYEKILEQLKQAEYVSIWIKPKDINDFQPKIFQITDGNNMILDYNDVIREQRPVLILLIAGISFIILYLYLRFIKR